MRVALYCRVSTEEQALHGLSIDAQKAALDDWAANYTVIDHYIDLGVSARKPISKRPELQRLFRDVQKDRIDLVVFTRLDRWTRNIREYYKAQDILDAHNVAWRAIQEDCETQTAAGRLKVNIMLAVAQDEADRTSERIKAVFEDKRRKGLAPTGSVPKGIRLVNGHDEPSEDAYIIRELFNAYIASRSARAIAPRFGYTAEGIKFVLKNHRYVDAGVVDSSTYETAQEILKTRSQRHTKRDRVFLFSGLVFCSCGSRLSGAAVPGKGKEYYYYRCISHNQGKPCPGTYISELKLEQYLLDNTIAKAKEVNVTITKKKKVQPDISKLKAKLDKLTDLYLNDLITKDKYEIEYRDVQAKIAEAEKEPQAVNTSELKTLLGAYQGLTRPGKKAFWSRLVNRIDVDGDTINFTLFYT